MAVVNRSIVTIKTLDSESYSLGSVTANPRAASAADIKAGLDNMAFEATEGTSDLALAVVKYLFQDYFVFAHQTGLYNRQIRLWEMFSRVSTAEIKQVERGIFKRTTLPVYEIVMTTAYNQSPVCAFIICKEVLESDHYKNYGPQAAGKIYVELLREFLVKVTKIQLRLGANGVKGVFVVTPEPLEAALLAYIEKETGANDPVSKVESIMPAVSAHVNLLTYRQDEMGEEGPASEPVISLAYPQINRKAAVSNQR